MTLSIHQTGDQSFTLYVPELDETFHSINGALTESSYIFLNKGLLAVNPAIDPLHILEVGFGTGLNAILTFGNTNQSDRSIQYHALETQSIPTNLIRQLNYESFLNPELLAYFYSMQESNWNQPINISPRFVLQKHLSPLQTFETNLRFDLVYFDAFSPDKQPELWTLDIFQKIFDLMNPGGILVTYSSKGEVKRNLKTSGFIVERLPGPPGKRHMIRAKKI